MTKHFKHLLGRYKVGESDHAVKHAREQLEALLKAKTSSELKDNWVEIQVFLYDTEKG